MSRGFFVVIALVIVGFIGLTVFNKNDSKPKAPALTFATVQKDVAAGGKLYDVRTPQEYAAGHFAGAVNLPVQDIANGKLPDAAKTAKLYVYCQTGSRSSQAAGLLKNAGYTAVTDLGGLARVESMGAKLTR